MKATPDRWVVLRVGDDHKVMGFWSGGYLDGDSWRLNSGIKSVYKDGPFYVVMGYSGSAYLCHEKAEGTTGYGAVILAGLVEHDGVEIVDGVAALEGYINESP